ncbi:MAG: serine/threonine-protein phosphatase [Phycisphaerae bacterium]|nr:serine/threonine-protein phosphatase [Phycisphaerae bacterium]
MTQMSVSSHPGPRDRLEDVVHAVEVRSACSSLSQRRASVVCDGVSSEKGGDIGAQSAADVFITAIVSALTPLSPRADACTPLPERVRAAMQEAAKHAHEAVQQQARAEAALHGMATTVVCAAQFDNQLIVLWAGDSRCYVDSGNALTQLTRDHSQVVELMEAGLLAPEEAVGHPSQHVITRCIGGLPACEPEICEHRLSPGDVILLCSDGLTDVVSDNEIHRFITACRDGAFPIAELSPRLVRQALRAGTADNVSVLCSQYERIGAPTSRTLTNQYLLHAAKAARRLEESNYV